MDALSSVPLRYRAAKLRGIPNAGSGGTTLTWAKLIAAGDANGCRVDRLRVGRRAA